MTKRETCGRETPGGTCAELEGHKSACVTVEEKRRYDEQMAALDPRNRRRGREQRDMALAPRYQAWTLSSGEYDTYTVDAVVVGTPEQARQVADRINLDRLAAAPRFDGVAPVSVESGEADMPVYVFGGAE